MIPDGATPLDGDEVWFVYRTQHDDRVRPSHAALDGSVWRVDDPQAPTPPIDYGCRCFIEYVSAPSAAKDPARLPPAPDEAEPRPLADVYADHLDENVKGWREVAAKAAEHPAPIRLAFIAAALRGQFVKADATDLARMVLTWLGHG